MRDRTEVRFVKGVPRFSKIASKIERDERGVFDEKELKRGDENRRRGVLVTVDGRPVRGRAALRPGAILQIGDETRVLRDVGRTREATRRGGGRKRNVACDVFIFRNKKKSE